MPMSRVRKKPEYSALAVIASRNRPPAIITSTRVNDVTPYSNPRLYRTGRASGTDNRGNSGPKNVSSSCGGSDTSNMLAPSAKPAAWAAHQARGPNTATNTSPLTTIPRAKAAASAPPTTSSCSRATRGFARARSERLIRLYRRPRTASSHLTAANVTRLSPSTRSVRFAVAMLAGACLSSFCCGIFPRASVHAWTRRLPAG